MGEFKLEKTCKCLQDIETEQDGKKISRYLNYIIIIKHTAARLQEFFYPNEAAVSKTGRTFS